MRRRIGSCTRLLLFAVLAVGIHASQHALGAEGQKSRTQAVMEELWGAMVAGGEWRTPNPDFEDTATTPGEFALRWRWGPHRQHVVGELVGVFDTAQGEKTALYWSLYAWHNPVTGEVTAMQVGWDGSMAVGPMRRADERRILVDQVLYRSDGTTVGLRHEEVMHDDGRSYDSLVYEREGTDAWVLKRRWVWRRVD